MNAELWLWSLVPVLAACLVGLAVWWLADAAEAARYRRSEAGWRAQAPDVLTALHAEVRTRHDRLHADAPRTRQEPR